METFWTFGEEAWLVISGIGLQEEFHRACISAATLERFELSKSPLLQLVLVHARTGHRWSMPGINWSFSFMFRPKSSHHTLEKDQLSFSVYFCLAASLHHSLLHLPLLLLIASCTHSSSNEFKSVCQWYRICSQKFCQFAKVPLVISEGKACQCASATYGELYMRRRVLYAFLDALF